MKNKHLNNKPEILKLKKRFIDKLEETILSIEKESETIATKIHELNAEEENDENDAKREALEKQLDHQNEALGYLLNSVLRNDSGKAKDLESKIAGIKFRNRLVMGLEKGW